MKLLKMKHSQRRHFMAAAAASLALPVLAQPRPAAGTERGSTRVAGFANAEIDYQLMRQLGTARYGGAAVGECLALAQRIQDGVPASWVMEFSAAAQRQEADAQPAQHPLPFAGPGGRWRGAEPLAQCERFQRAVGGPVARHVFTAEEGAEGHCQTGNLAYSAAVSMDWLDELFGG